MSFFLWARFHLLDGIRPLILLPENHSVETFLQLTTKQLVLEMPSIRWNLHSVMRLREISHNFRGQEVLQAVIFHPDQ